MISVLVAAHNSEAFLDSVLLKSLSLNTRCRPFEVVVYDNGGNGRLDARLGEKWQIDLTILGDGVNVGLNQALNACAAKAKYKYFYLPHTDMYAMPGWDLALVEFSKELPPASYLLCSRSIEPVRGHTAFHIIRNYGTTSGEFDEPGLLRDFLDHQDFRVVTGYRMPFFLDRGLWEKMGGVDPTYFSYCTDDDLVQTAFSAGVRRFGMVFGSLVYHFQGKSNETQQVDRDSDWPYRYFVSKWKRGFDDAAEPSSWHPKLIPGYLRVR